ncbi:type I polyketide synthase [Nocardia sp. NPDC006044]|uniref:type I polyketide synthase n=1 Tax=Nocardia sp. NPDC006044 TaxID=3364306 RepID=UPI0036ACFEF0
MANEAELRTYLKKAAADLHKTRQRLRALESRVSEPIAIIGMACRYPGGISSPAELWTAISEGRDLISEWPTDRGWDVANLFDPDHPGREGKSYVRNGGFVHDATEFDAGFFGISPHEAVAMDPRQRTALESAWEAIEYSGIDPLALRGSDTGVFLGMMSDYYGPTTAEVDRDDLDGVLPFLMTGQEASVASGRVAYALGLQGPAVTLDTACSSSLVALHQAGQSLRSGECALALAGGVTVMASPIPFVGFSLQRALAPDGRCKSFAAAADGTIWSEGVGMLLLERASDARRHGHRILALLRGSAVNQDGASNGLSAPNGGSQQRVIRQALANAGVPAADVDMVEAHGTATVLGDPIEAQAVQATYGMSRPAGRPLWLGTIKSNMGHTQAAAGVAGVIKVVEAMRHEVMPPTLHVDAPTPHVDWSVGDVRLLTEAQPWPRRARPRRAGVSSFGISGTNSHVIIEEAPADEAVESSDRAVLPVIPWIVTAKTANGLAAQAAKLLAFVRRHPDADPMDVGYSLVVSRTVFDHRAVVSGRDMAELIAGLLALAEDREAPGVVRGRADSDADAETKSVFMFPGQGSQRAGMGRGLCSAFPVFATAFDAACAGFDGQFEQSLRAVIFAEPESAEAGLLDQTAYTQAAMFVVEVALYRLLESWGVAADLMLGHSIGEVTAAYLAGVWSLPDACALVAARGRLMQALPSGGAMVSVTAQVDEVNALLRGLGRRVSVAAVNGPESVVISGDEAAVADVAAMLEGTGARSKRLRVSHAFHSPRMDAMLADFTQVCERLTYREPRIGVVSNVTGELATAEQLCSPDYWVRHVREPVRFADGLAWARADGGRSFLEVGPVAALTVSAQSVLEQELEQGVVVVTGTSRSKDDADRALMAGLAELYTGGAQVDWRAVFAGTNARRIDLPTYAFDRTHYWLDASGGANVTAAGLATAGHPLLGATVSLAQGDGLLLSGLLSLQSRPWLGEHRVGGVALLPGAALVELALHIGELVDSPVLGELVLQAPVVIPEAGAIELQVVAGGVQESGERSVGVYSRPQTNGDDPLGAAWVCHTTGVLRADDVRSPRAADSVDLAVWPPVGAVAVQLGDVYAGLADLGYSYGPVFRGLKAVWRQGDSIFAEVELPEQARGEAGRFGVHPALLDATMHALIVTADAADGPDSGAVRLPFSWEGVSLHAVGASSLRVRLRATGADSIELTLADPSGALVAEVAALTIRAVSLAALGAAQTSVVDDALFGVDWVPVPAPERSEAEWIASDAVHGNGSSNGSAAAPERAVISGGELVVVRRCPAVGDDNADSAVPERIRAGATETLGQIQELLADPAASRIVVVTSRAVATRGDEDVTDFAGAAVWGLLRTAQNENPGRILLVDIDDPDDYREAAIAASLGSESQLAIRGGVAHAPRLVRVELDRPDVHEHGRTGRFDPVGTVLVTGGTGGLGGVLARHLVAVHGVRHLVLSSRRGAEAAGAAELVAELTDSGAAVTVVACDVTDRAAVRRLIGGIDTAHPLTAVIHVAGVLDDALFTAQTPESVATVFGPKVDAAWHLHEATRELPLTAFVLYSSVAGSLGTPGQANYSAANAVLDALAQHRRVLGLPATAMAWGLWERATGMTGHLQDADRERMRRSGFSPISDDDGMALFDAALASGRALTVPARIDLGVLRKQHGDFDEVPALLRGLLRASRRVADGGTAESSKLVASLVGLSKAEQERIVLDAIRTHAAAVLGHASSDAVPADTPFMDLGFDSLGAIEFRNRLQSATGVKLSTTIVFDYPNAVELARYLGQEIAPEDNPAARILAQVDALAASCATVALAHTDLSVVAIRLNDIVRSLHGEAAAGRAIADVDAAEDDELFDFLDKSRPASRA